MDPEPLAGEITDSFQRSGLGEQMGRTQNDHQPGLGAGHTLDSNLVRADHLLVGAANDKQRWRRHPGQGGTGEIRPTATGDNRPDRLVGTRSRDESGGRTCARSEVADGQSPRRVVRSNEPGRVDETLRQHLNVEAMVTGVGTLWLGCGACWRCLLRTAASWRVFDRVFDISIGGLQK